MIHINGIQKSPEIVQHATSCKNPEDIMLNEIKLQKCSYYVTPHIYKVSRSY